MYEIDVLFRDSFKYSVRSLNYEIKIDFPKADGVPVEGITPPALLLASLGSCLGVYLERYLNGAKIHFDKFSIKVKSDICKDSPHYLKAIDVRVELAGGELDDKRKAAALEFLKNCPVHNTLTHKPKINIGFIDGSVIQGVEDKI